MSCKSRKRRKEKQNSKLQIKKQAKKSRQKHDPQKWKEKKAKKKIVQEQKWNCQHSKANYFCPLNIFEFPSQTNCKGCNLHCPYNPE